jgi:hypothetical protein
MPLRLRHLPGRLTTGAFILNSGITKWSADQATAEATHGIAAGAYPFLRVVPPGPFLKALSVGETALGAALLIPVVPAGLAGLGLTVFSATLLGMYARTPAMRQDGSIRPSRQGIALAKDVWMLGIGLGLVVDDLTDRGHRG